MRLYVDSSKCTGCHACEVACSLNLFQESNPKKSALNLIPHFPSPGVYEMKVCTQCGDCAKVCPTEAIKLNDRGYEQIVKPRVEDLAIKLHPIQRA